MGGQATSSDSIDIIKIAKANGYANVTSIDQVDKLKMKIEKYFYNVGPVFLEIKTKFGSRPNLGRPTIKPEENKLALMDYLNKDK